MEPLNVLLFRAAVKFFVCMQLMLWYARGGGRTSIYAISRCAYFEFAHARDPSRKDCCHPFQIIGTLFIHGTGLNSNSIAAELRHCMFTIAGHINAYQLILMDSESLLSQAAADQHDLLGCFEVEPLAKW